MDITQASLIEIKDYRQCNTRSFPMDLLKSFSIIAVFLYHFGILTYGYLGVEVFFIISGYNFARRDNYSSFRNDVVPGILKSLKKQYFLILGACAVSYCVAFLLLFPIYFKSLSYNLLATVTLSSNILQAIKSTDYWAAANATNPLMHMWYICVLIKCQITLSLIIYLSKKVFKNIKTYTVYALVFLLSLFLNLIPSIPQCYKFYLVPFRIYEIAIGCLLFNIKQITDNKIKTSVSKPVTAVIYLLLLSTIIFSDFIEIDKAIPKIIVLLSASAILICDSSIYQPKVLSVANVACIPGRYSYPIYIWHQIVIAFALQLVFDESNFECFVFITLVTLVLVILTEFISKRRLVNRIKGNKVIVIALIALSLLVYGIAYCKRGVFFDYPELGLSSESPDPDGWIQYVDEPHNWSRDFEDPDKLHVYVIGNSYGRDMANVLNESPIRNQIELSYDTDSSSFESLKPRIDAADVVFYSVDFWDVREDLLDYCYDKMIIVGNKQFSKNTKIWLTRNSDEYFDTVATIPDEFLEENENFKEKYGDHYLDMMSYVMVDDNHQRVFTDDNYYISIDGKHLCQKGAQYYAEQIDFEDLFQRVLN